MLHLILGGTIMQITVDKKGLESLLAGLKDFETPKWQLEQWQTPPDIASAVSYTHLTLPTN